MSKRFYNAGDKIDETLAYSIPNGQDVHCIARWPLICPREEFFDVITELEFKQTGESIQVQFFRDVTRKFGHRGVVLIDPSYNPEIEDPEADLEKYPFARDEEEAILRGRELWMRYLRNVVQSHLNDCESARAAGGAPRSAQGFTKRAMKLLKIQDPGEQYFNSLQHGGAGEQSKSSDNGEIEALKATNAMMLQLMIAIASGKQVDPAELAKLAATPTPPSTPTSGVATGEIKKPITNVGGVDHELPKYRSKDDRKKDAEKQLAG